MIACCWESSLLKAASTFSFGKSGGLEPKPGHRNSPQVLKTCALTWASLAQPDLLAANINDFKSCHVSQKQEPVTTIIFYPLYKLLDIFILKRIPADVTGSPSQGCADECPMKVALRQLTAWTGCHAGPCWVMRGFLQCKNQQEASKSMCRLRNLSMVN